MPGVASAVIGSISRAFNAAPAAERPSEVILIPLADNGDNDPSADVMRFQYFPESIQDNKAVNYQQKEIPGGSLPIYQWVSSGERLISFNVQFSCDTDLTVNSTLRDTVSQNGLQDRNVDIRSAVAWLRQNLFPRYSSATSSNSPSAGSAAGSAAGSGGGSGGGNAGGFTFSSTPPRRLRLFIPNSGIGVAGGQVSHNGQIYPHSVLCVMTQCDVTWDAYFPSGLPRLATVSLAFAQIPQTGGNVRFPTASGMENAVKGDGVSANQPFYGYKLRATPRTGFADNAVNGLGNEKIAGR